MELRQRQFVEARRRKLGPNALEAQLREANTLGLAKHADRLSCVIIPMGSPIEWDYFCYLYATTAGHRTRQKFGVMVDAERVTQMSKSYPADMADTGLPPPRKD